MNKKAWILTLVLALIISSCSKTPENLATREVIDGIEYVHNTAKPQYPDATLSLGLELSIGGEDQEGNVIIFSPGMILIDEDEKFYITDTEDFNIKVFDSEGNHLNTISKKGEGPGELQSAGYIRFTPDGRLLVSDYQARRTSLFNEAGVYISSHQWKTLMISRAVLTTNSSYFVEESIREKDAEPFEARKLFVSEIDFKGNKLRSFSGFKNPESQIIREGDMSLRMSVPYSRRSLFTGDIIIQNWYHCLNNLYVIEVYDTNGKLCRKIDRPYDPIPITSRDKEEFLARFENSSNEILKKAVKSRKFPSNKPVVARLLTDDESNLWVGTNETKEEEGVEFRVYDIFSSDGVYEKKVWLEISPVIIKKDKMYIFHIDEETGYRYARRYKMVWSE